MDKGAEKDEKTEERKEDEGREKEEAGRREGGGGGSRREREGRSLMSLAFCLLSANPANAWDVLPLPVEAPTTLSLMPLPSSLVGAAAAAGGADLVLLSWAAV